MRVYTLHHGFSMKKYLFLLLLICFHFPLAAHLITFNKQDILHMADTEKHLAITELKKAESISWYVPDLGDRQHLNALIISSIATPLIPEARIKILSVGLSLIGSISIEMYNEYCELRDHLAMASYHFEMHDFYSKLSLHMPNSYIPPKNKQWIASKAYLHAIDLLTLCDMLAMCISDDFQGVKNWISEDLLDLRECIFKQMNAAPGMITAKLSERAEMYYENFYEVVADYVSDYQDDFISKDTCNKLASHLEEIWTSLLTAEKYWGYN